jgi:signal transduction histidine kinase
MRLPRLFRTTPFRLTLGFLALFAASASAFLAYIYFATAWEVTTRADERVQREMDSLTGVYNASGPAGLNQAVAERTGVNPSIVYLLTHADGSPPTGSLGKSPVNESYGREHWVNFIMNQTDADGMEVRRPARGLERKLPDGERLFVGADVGEQETYVVHILRSLWGAGAMVILIGLGGGLMVSRNFSSRMEKLTAVTNAVRAGDLTARAPLRGTGEEYDELAEGLNHMLDRLLQSMGGLRHAGDAIAHDLRSPLTRLRAKLEAALIEVDAGRADPVEALGQALDDTDGVLATFAAVLAIARLEAAGEAPDQTIFDPGQLAQEIADLYGPVCEDKDLEFAAELTPGLSLKANRQFLAQAITNILDNAVKYTPRGGAVMLRLRRRSTGEVEISVTDTGPGIPEKDRERVLQRFVRLQSSRTLPGVGLGLSLVDAVARAHGGRLELSEGPGSVRGSRPGLRVALILPNRPEWEMGKPQLGA